MNSVELIHVVVRRPCELDYEYYQLVIITYLVA